MIATKQLTLIFAQCFCILLAACSSKTEQDVSVEQYNLIIEYEDAEHYTAGGGSGTAQDLKIEWLRGNVSIQKYDGKTICFEETCTDTLAEAQQLHHWENGKLLSIHFCQSGEQINDTLSKNLIINIPKNISLNNISFISDASDLQMENVRCNEISAKTSSGSLTLQSTHCTEIHLQSISGDILLKQSNCNKYFAKSTSGKLSAVSNKCKEYTVESISGNISMENNGNFIQMRTVSTYGNICLCMPKISGFTLKAKIASGNISSNFPVTIHENTYSYGNRKSVISAESMTGNLKLTKW